MKNLKEEFGNKLKNLRKNQNYTQEVLAEKIDLSQRQLIRIENGKNFPSVETINRIMNVLDVDLDNLFDFNRDIRALELIDISTVDNVNKELYYDILQKIRNFSSDAKKLKYIKLSIDAINDKQALENLKIFVNGMDINS